MAEEDSFCNVDLHYREHEEIYCREQSRHRRATTGLCDCSVSICGSRMHGCRWYIKWLCLITPWHLCDLGERGLLKEPWKSTLFQWLLYQMHEWFIVQQQDLRAAVSQDSALTISMQSQDVTCFSVFHPVNFELLEYFLLKKNIFWNMKIDRFEYLLHCLMHICKHRSNHWPDTVFPLLMAVF